MTHRQTISVVVPVYNKALYLAQCLDSALCQTFPDLDIVCVDDGSTDGSGDILDRYARSDARIRVLRAGQNRGQSAARNCGLDIARGGEVFFMDADDTIPPGAIEALHSCSERCGCELAMGKLLLLEAASDSQSLALPPPMAVQPVTTSVHASGYLQLIPGHHCCNLYSVHFLREHDIRYPEDLSLGGDQVFQAAAITQATRVTLVDEVVYYWHHYREGSVTRRRQSLRNLLDQIEHVRRVARLLMNAGLEGAGRRMLQRWPYSITEYWQHMSVDLSADEARRVFSRFREVIAEFGVTPWNDSTPPEHRRLLELLLQGSDDVALRGLQVLASA